MLRIVFTGPESSGKTTLAQHLAAYYGVPWVPEYARVYLDSLTRPYEAEDLLKIAKGQIYREDRIGAGNPPLIFCDTDLLTIKIWAAHKYGQVDPWILEQINQRSYDHYFLCWPDIPWQADPLREHPEERDALYAIYQKELIAYGKSFTELSGDFEKRLTSAKQLIDSYLTNSWK